MRTSEACFAHPTTASASALPFVVARLRPDRRELRRAKARRLRSTSADGALPPSVLRLARIHPIDPRQNAAREVPRVLDPMLAQQPHSLGASHTRLAMNDDGPDIPAHCKSG